MARLVAFLRGINVGGRTVKKATLQEAFTSIGFQNIFTYKQSGNIIFETNNSDVKEITNRIEDKLNSVLGYCLKVIVRTMPQLKNMIKDQPFRVQNKETASFLVTMLPNTLPVFPLKLPLIIPNSTAKILSVNGTEIFTETHGGGEGA